MLLFVEVVQSIFFLFALLLVVASLMTVLARNPVQSALSLVFAFFAASVLWILLEAEFLGLVLILVYVGAVMTLFLFVIMTLNIHASEEQRGFVTYFPYAVISVAVLLGMLIYAILSRFISSASITQGAGYNNTQALGDVLYTQYAYPFEIVGVLLLVAIVATIALSAREKRLNKAIPPKQQLLVHRENRLHIIKMQPEKKI